MKFSFLTKGRTCEQFSHLYFMDAGTKSSGAHESILSGPSGCILSVDLVELIRVAVAMSAKTSDGSRLCRSIHLSSNG